MKYVLSVLAVSLAVPASADTLGPYTDLLVFGDSLSDPGNRFELTNGTEPPQSLYPLRQFTNGDTWAATLGADFDSGTNFAYGGATAITNDDIYPDFTAQRLEYYDADVSLGDNPLTAVNFGGNDLRSLIGDALPTEEEIGALFFQSIGSIAAGINELAATGLDDFLVFSAPKLSNLPDVIGTSLEPLVFSLVDGYNTALENAVLAYQGSPINVQIFDIVAAQDEIFANAAALGLTNTTDACLTPNNPETEENEFFFCGILEDPNTYFFFDGLHPTNTVHSEIAWMVQTAVTPVPLPGSLGLAFGGLVLLGGIARRRKVASV
ncbi:MAG: hypothetical protein KJN60_05040 [Boseongicola sp.]|nr:hypothetical protein [Boseongicola sp.]